MKPFRIALFHNLVSGGAKRSVYEYARALFRRGHTLDLFTLNEREEEFLSVRPFVGRVCARDYSPALSLGDHTFLLSPLRPLEWRRLMDASARMAEEIDRGGYDVAFVHASRFIQCPLVLRYLRRTPAIYYCHETFRFLTEPHPPLGTFRDRLRSGVIGLLRPWMMPLADAERESIGAADRVLTNSRFTRDNLLRAYGIDSGVSYQGVDTDHFRPTGEGQENAVLCVGQPTRWKAQDFLVRALARIPADVRPELVLVFDKGNANYIRWLETLAAEAGVSLRLRPNVGEGELVRLYNASKVFVYAPFREPFGFVPLEAMACGTPVVAVLEGGVREVLRPGSGSIGVSRDPDAFARALEPLLVSQERRNAAGRQCREYVLAHWSWERAAERLEAEIARLVSRKAGAPPSAGGPGGESPPGGEA
jgi:glycosyltransferase involved in cell wall biosynthesis